MGTKVDGPPELESSSHSSSVKKVKVVKQKSSKNDDSVSRSSSTRSKSSRTKKSSSKEKKEPKSSSTFVIFENAEVQDACESSVSSHTSCTDDYPEVKKEKSKDRVSKTAGTSMRSSSSHSRSKRNGRSSSKSRRPSEKEPAEKHEKGSSSSKGHKVHESAKVHQAPIAPPPPEPSNPFVTQRDINAPPHVEGNPFLEAEQPYSTPQIPDEVLRPQNTAIQKMDMTVVERLQAGEVLTNQEALLLTVDKLRERTEKMEDDRTSLLGKIMELEELLEERESKIKALEFYFKKLKEGGEGGGMPYLMPLSTGGDDDSDGDNGHHFRRHGQHQPVSFTASRPSHGRQSSTVDISVSADPPPPKLTATFQRAGAKMRRAKESVHPNNPWEWNGE